MRQTTSCPTTRPVQQQLDQLANELAEHKEQLAQQSSCFARRFEKQDHALVTLAISCVQNAAAEALQQPSTLKRTLGSALTLTSLPREVTSACWRS